MGREEGRWGTLAGSCRGTGAASLSNSSTHPTPHTRTPPHPTRELSEAPYRHWSGKQGCLWRGRRPPSPTPWQPGAGHLESWSPGSVCSTGSPSTCKSPPPGGASSGQVCGALQITDSPNLSQNQLPESKACGTRGGSGVLVTQLLTADTSHHQEAMPPEETAPWGSNRNSN